MDYVVYLGLGLSLSANALLSYLYFFKKSHVLTVEAQKLLADLMAGGATVRMQVLDSANLLYRSPRG
jgi:hypothetical protein